MAGVSWAWVKKDQGCQVPQAVGNDGTLVAGAFHEGGFIPGMYHRGTCTIPWGCNGHVKQEYYLLSCPPEMTAWAEGADGGVPMGAIQGGRSESGEPLYIGRYTRNGRTYIGKVHPSHGVCYIACDGRELNSKTYDVLCFKTVPVSLPGEKYVPTEERECPVCTDEYCRERRHPLILPACGHTLCRYCLTQIANGALEFSCPICRTRHRGSVGQLQINFGLLNLL